MKEKARRRSVADEKPPTVAIRCQEEGCSATTQIRFKGTSPYLSYRMAARDWTGIEDEYGTVRFLCKKCGEPLSRQIEEDIKRREQEESGTGMPSWLAKEGRADGKEDEDP